MYEQEIKKVVHIMVLLCYTFLSITMIGYSIAHRGEWAAAVMLILGLAASWTIHFTAVLSAPVRLWIYTAILMLAFFFYGTHEQSVFDMAPILLGFLLVYTSTEDPRFIRVCVAVYYFTVCCDFLFIPTGSQALPSYPAGRVVIHFVIVFLGERLSEAIIQKLRREKNTEDTISRLEKANQSAEDFLANASHELRTPINAVTGITAAMLKHEGNLEKRENLLSIQMAGIRLFEQLEDILDYSEIDTDRVHVSEEAYTIPSMVNDVIVENQLVKWHSDVELIFDVDPQIPAVLLGDGRKIKKIVKHLTDNAMKFTKKAAPISGSTRCAGNIIRSIRDRNLELQERLFRLLVLIGLCGLAAGIVNSVIIGDDVRSICIMTAAFAFFVGIFYYSLRFRKIQLGAVIIAILILFVILPSTFLTSGGILGGAPVWFLFGMVYVCLVMEGKGKYILDLFGNPRAQC